MKNSRGYFYRITSKKDYDNFGFKIKFDIIIIFNEVFEISPDIEDTLDLVIEGSLRGLALENPFTKAADVKARLQLALSTLGYEADKVIVEQALNWF